MAHPSYEDVCTETTGHAEVVKVDFDPAKVSLARVLINFFESHNPPRWVAGRRHRPFVPLDRSCTRIQRRKPRAEAARTEAQKNFSDPIVTEIAQILARTSSGLLCEHPRPGLLLVVIRQRVEQAETPARNRPVTGRTPGTRSRVAVAGVESGAEPRRGWCRPAPGRANLGFTGGSEVGRSEDAVVVAPVRVHRVDLGLQLRRADWDPGA